jgi:hypothetical protein
MAYNLFNEDYNCIRTNKFVPFQFRIASTKKFPQVTSKLFKVYTLKTFLLGRINVSLLDLQSINLFRPKGQNPTEDSTGNDVCSLPPQENNNHRSIVQTNCFQAGIFP